MARAGLASADLPTFRREEVCRTPSGSGTFAYSAGKFNFAFLSTNTAASAHLWYCLLVKQRRGSDGRYDQSNGAGCRRSTLKNKGGREIYLRAPFSLEVTENSQKAKTRKYGALCGTIEAHLTDATLTVLF